MSITRVIRTAGGVGALFLCSVRLAGAPALAADPSAGTRVSGHGVDWESTAIVHSEERTSAGVIRISTATVELDGDLRGWVLYQVTTQIDSAKGTLVNTGQQVYSGTILGSEPVLIRDDRFRFEVDTTSGSEHGTVYLTHRLAGAAVQCTLSVVGTGKRPDGNPTFSYTGECRFPRGAALPSVRPGAR
jgi:hypothetical protein